MSPCCRAARDSRNSFQTRSRPHTGRFAKSKEDEGACIPGKGVSSKLSYEEASFESLICISACAMPLEIRTLLCSTAEVSIEQEVTTPEHGFRQDLGRFIIAPDSCAFRYQ